MMMKALFTLLTLTLLGLSACSDNKPNEASAVAAEATASDETSIFDEEDEEAEQDDAGAVAEAVADEEAFADEFAEDEENATELTDTSAADEEESETSAAPQTDFRKLLASATKGKMMYYTSGLDEVQGFDMLISQYCKDPVKNYRQMIRTATAEFGEHNERVIVANGILLSISTICVATEKGEEEIPVEEMLFSGRNNCADKAEKLDGMCDLTIGEAAIIFLDKIEKK
ncbi:hypothetical protein CGZ60_00055 [Neisseria animalis]|nr:hypothetical protein CGZ60_00055 [Neisseria animalis]